MSDTEFVGLVRNYVERHDRQAAKWDASCYPGSPQERAEMRMDTELEGSEPCNDMRAVVGESCRRSGTLATRFPARASQTNVTANGARAVRIWICLPTPYTISRVICGGDMVATRPGYRPS